MPGQARPGPGQVMTLTVAVDHFFACANAPNGALLTIEVLHCLRGAVRVPCRDEREKMELHHATARHEAL